MIWLTGQHQPIREQISRAELKILLEENVWHYFQRAIWTWPANNRALVWQARGWYHEQRSTPSGFDETQSVQPDPIRWHFIPQAIECYIKYGHLKRNIRHDNYSRCHPYSSICIFWVHILGKHTLTPGSIPVVSRSQLTRPWFPWAYLICYATHSNWPIRMRVTSHPQCLVGDINNMAARTIDWDRICETSNIE